MDIKEKLLQACKVFAIDKLKAIQENLNELNDSVNSDSKSTAGDKHETGRAMLHLEQEKAGEQLLQAQEMVLLAEKIMLHKSDTKAHLGSLVKTNRGLFFIAISAGKITIDKTDYYAVSPKAPIAQKLIGCKEGEQFKFNGLDYMISDII